jgi:arginase
MNIHLIGVPMDLGAGRRGVDMGPSAIRIAGIDERLVELGNRVKGTSTSKMSRSYASVI